MSRSRSSRRCAPQARRSKGEVPEREGQQGLVGLGRPEQGALPGDPVPELVQLRAGRVLGRRADDLARDRADLQARRLPALAHAAGGGVWRTKNALAGQPNWEFLVRLVRDQRRRLGRRRPERPVRQHDLRGHRRGQLCGSAAPRASASTSRRTAATRGPARSAARRPIQPPAQGIGDDRRQARQPEHALRRHDTAVRGMSRRSAARAATRSSRAPRSGASTSRRTAGRRWTFIHNGAATTRAVHRRRDRVAQRRRRARRAASAASSSIRRTRRSSTPRSYARGVWRSPDGGATWTQINPSLNPADTTTRAAIAVTKLRTARRGCTSTRASTAPRRAGSSARTTSPPACPSFTNLTNASVGQPRLRNAQPVHRPVLVRRLRLHAEGPPGHRLRRRLVLLRRGRSPTSAAVVLSTDAGVSGTDMTFDGTDSLHPNGLHPDQHALVTNPNNPMQFFEANDGGVMRSSGELRRPLGVVHRTSEPRALRRRARALPADALEDPVEARGDQQGPADAPVPEPLGQPAQQERCCRAARRTTARGRRRGTRSSGRTR